MEKHMSRGCDQWRGDLGAYVIGALDGDECGALERHLAACPACRTDYKSLLPVRDVLARTRRHLATCWACRLNYADLLH
jgi:anti-sigma factor RsiW